MPFTAGQKSERKRARSEKRVGMNMIIE